MRIVILILLLMHIIGDFYFQCETISKCKVGKYDNECLNCNKCESKKSINYLILLKHVGIYCIPFIFLFLIIKWYFVLVVLVIVFITHYVIDIITCYLKKYKNNKTLFFILDQLLHLIILSVISYFIVKICNPIIPNCIEKNIIKQIVLIFLLIKPSSIIINNVFSDTFTKNKNDIDEINISEGKKFDTGSVIGVIERLIIYILTILQAYPTIAIIITVKTWARANDIKEDKDFRNKYLVGTLLSILLGLIIGYCSTII